MIGFIVGLFLLIVAVVIVWSGMKWMWYVELKGYMLVAPSMHVAQVELKSRIHTYAIVGEDMREEVECEFDEPLKYLNLIMHAYDTNPEMYADYIVLADNDDLDLSEEIWGWSNCMWQPDDSWAACDVYYVKPDFVHADMNIDTIGHEVTHGICGDYHD